MVELRMPDVNAVLIAGNLTRDPSFRKTTNGTPVTNFWIASNRKFKDNAGQWRESVCYVGVVAWYKLAESCAENLHKGAAVLIEGELQSRSLNLDNGRNRNVVEIKARRIQFLNRKDDAMEDAEAESSASDDDVHDAFDSMENHPDPESDEAAKGDEEISLKQETLSSDATDNPMKGKFDFGFQDL